VERFESEHTLDFAYTMEKKARFRGNIFRQCRGLAASFRLIPLTIKNIKELGLPGTVEDFGRLTRGLVLVTGPAGSGKSTTLAALVHLINQERKNHIITLEDPLEFIHDNINCLINQRQIGDHFKSFSSALRAAFREDPNVILVGEMRDLETIALAITAAEAGLMVLGTLHTASAAKTVDRIIDAFPKEQQAQVRVQLSESLKGVIAQNLVPRADGSGRIAVVEILVGTPAVQNLIREGKTFQMVSVMQTGKRDGMQMFDQCLQNHLNDKLITPETAYKHAYNKSLFQTGQRPKAHALT
jgi:twitching motility protein PilT